MVVEESEQLKKKVQEFWNENPCATWSSSKERFTREYFDEVEAYRYALQFDQKEIVGFDHFSGKKVLEIGCGQGTDGRQFAQAGAIYTGVDLTSAAIELTRRNFETHGLQGTFQQEDAEKLSFSDNTFDVVYSYGVLHHTPRTDKTFEQIFRVLKPGGKFIVMLYHRNSWNYYVNIMLLRRIGALMLMLPAGPQLAHILTKEPLERLKQHQRNLRSRGLAYLANSEFLSQNTDGPGNPLSRVYSRKELQELLQSKGFVNIRTEVSFLHKRWMPLVGRLLSRKMETLLGRWIGWHVYGFSEKPPLR